MKASEYQNRVTAATTGTIAAALSMVALTFRCRDFIISGRLWDEDGTVFLPAMLNERSLWFLYNGHFEGWSNLVAWIASFSASWSLACSGRAVCPHS